MVKNPFVGWEVIAEGAIIGCSDGDIKNVVPADLNRILAQTEIRTIYANGATAYRLYMKYSYGLTGREIVKLPSTSPANAAFSLERLIREWEREIRTPLSERLCSTEKNNCFKYKNYCDAAAGSGCSRRSK